MVAPKSAPDLSYLTDTLPTLIPPIFEQVQHTTANHRKNLVALRKIHETCANVTEQTPKGTKLSGEKQFNAVFTDMVNRVLGAKKGVAVADRVVKYVAAYVAYCTEQDAANRAEDAEEEETTASRFVTKLLKHLLSGMEAKDKNVRFRVTLLTVSMINGLGEMDDDLYVTLRSCLLDRSRDKDTAVRVQAALGLAKLQDGEDEEDLEEGEESLAQVLLDLLRYDPAAEVRRAALYNLPRTPANLPYILARTRDIDPVLRRTVYHGSLSSAGLPDARVLSIAQREDVVRNGLGDREGNVRKAAAGMLGGWFDQAGCDVIEFLSRFDVVSSMVAEDALSSLFTTRQEVYHSIEFEEEYWANLTPERAFLARVFVDHCISTKDNVRLEDSLPVVTHFAFRIQDQYNSLVQTEEADLPEKTFIVGELLKLAVNLDYADENGRRQMFSLTRDMLKEPNLPESLIPGCLDILCKISNNERDYIRVVVEDVITDLREGEVEEESETLDSQASTYSTTPARRKVPGMPGATRTLADDPEARLKAALMDLRCLVICISLLERVNSALQDNSVFHGLLPDLIIPAVQNKEEPALREQGLVCLGLCCMLDARIAKESIGLFISQISAGDIDLRVRVMRIIMDLLMVHDVSGLMPADKSAALIPHLLQQEQPEVLAIAVEGVAKMMLAGMISDDEILQSLVLLYFSSETAENQALRQCLAYFLPVYCYSASVNQRRMLSIFSETFSILAEICDDDAAEGDMPPLAQMGLMVVDWLDPEKAVERDGVPADTTMHLDLAIEIGKTLLTERSREIRKALVSFILKLNLPEGSEADAIKVQTLVYLFNAVRSKRPMSETASRNALVKFDAVLLKRYPEQLEGFADETFGEDEREAVQAVVALVDSVEAKEDTPSEAGPGRRGSSSVPRAKRGSRASSRANSSVAASSADEDDGEEDEEEDTSSGAAERQKLSRSAKGKGTLKVVEEEDEDEDEEEGDAEEEEEQNDVEEEEDEEEEEVEEVETPVKRGRKVRQATEEEEDDVDMEEAAMRDAEEGEEDADEDDEENEEEENEEEPEEVVISEPEPEPKRRKRAPASTATKAAPAKAPTKAAAKSKAEVAPKSKSAAASKTKPKAKAPPKVKAPAKGKASARGKAKATVQDEEEDDSDVESMLDEDPL